MVFLIQIFCVKMLRTSFSPGVPSEHELAEGFPAGNLSQGLASFPSQVVAALSLALPSKCCWGHCHLCRTRRQAFIFGQRERESEQLFGQLIRRSALRCRGSAAAAAAARRAGLAD